MLHDFVFKFSQGMVEAVSEKAVQVGKDPVELAARLYFDGMAQRRGQQSQALRLLKGRSLTSYYSSGVSACFFSEEIHVLGMHMSQCFQDTCLVVLHQVVLSGKL